MEALVARDPSRLPWAPHARFTENNVPLRVGDGLWGTISGKRDYKTYVADPAQGSVGFYGVIEQHGIPAIFALRLQVDRGQIAAAETLVARVRKGSEIPNPDGLINKTIFNEVLPPEARRTREQLLTVANSYFETVQQNDGTVYVPLDPRCHRIENGIETTNNTSRPADSGNALPSKGCLEQFQSGYFRFVTTIRARRFLAVDVERGLVLTSGFFDHAGGMRSVTMTNGTTHPIGAPFDMPYSFAYFELFRIEHGKLRQVESVLEDVPYRMPNPWEQINVADERAPASFGTSATSGGAVSASCDRQCLEKMTDDYLAALARRSPMQLPWAERVRFTENNVVLMLDQGAWATVDSVQPAYARFADVSRGQVGAFAVIVENGHASHFSVRLKVVDRRITEAETLVSRADWPAVDRPARTAPDYSALVHEIVPTAERSTREDLITIADSYYATLQQNNGRVYAPFDPKCNRVESGVQTSNNNTQGLDYSPGAKIMRLGCDAQFRTGFFRYVTQIRDRRFLVVDEERGLVFVASLFDHAGVMNKVTLTDGRVVPSEFLLPWSWQAVEMFKIRNGKIRHIEAMTVHTPYGSGDVWKHANPWLAMP